MIVSSQAIELSTPRRNSVKKKRKANTCLPDPKVSKASAYLEHTRHQQCWHGISSECKHGTSNTSTASAMTVSTASAIPAQHQQ